MKKKRIEVEKSLGRITMEDIFPWANIKTRYLRKDEVESNFNKRVVEIVGNIPLSEVAFYDDEDGIHLAHKITRLETDKEFERRLRKEEKAKKKQETIKDKNIRELKKLYKIYKNEVNLEELDEENNC